MSNTFSPICFGSEPPTIIGHSFDCMAQVDFAVLIEASGRMAVTVPILFCRASVLNKHLHHPLDRIGKLRKRNKTI